MIAPRERLPVACWATSASFYIILYYIIVLYFTVVYLVVFYLMLHYFIYIYCSQRKGPSVLFGNKDMHLFIYFIYLNLFECI